MKWSNIPILLNACAWTMAATSCDRTGTTSETQKSFGEERQPGAGSKPPAITRSQEKKELGDTKHQTSQEDARVEKHLSRALDVNAPREERIAALHQIAGIDSEASSKALAVLISLETSDDAERKVFSPVSASTRYPAIKAIKSRGKAAVPSLCQQLLKLAANDGNSTDIRLICMTALTLEPPETIKRHLVSLAESGKYSADVLAEAQALIESFSGRFPRFPN